MLQLMYALYLALYHGLFGFLLALIAARRNGFSLRALVFTPFVWVAVELARTYITGFPWDLLGTTQIDNIPLSRVATVTGVYGISFEIVLVNTAVAAAFLVPRERRNVLLTASLAAAIVLHAGKLVHPPPLPAERGRHDGAGECSHPRFRRVDASTISRRPSTRWRRSACARNTASRARPG